MKLRFRMRFGAFVLLTAMCATSQAALTTFTGTFSGLNENPTNASTATGSITAILDDVAFTLQLNATFTGLQGTVTQAHIHAPAASPLVNAGVALGNTSLPSFPLGVNSGTYNQSVSLVQANFNTGFFTNNGGTEALVRTAFITAMKNNQSYFNIHTSSFAGGEIRANLIAVPEPSSCALLGLSAVAFAVRRRLGKKPLIG